MRAQIRQLNGLFLAFTVAITATLVPRIGCAQTVPISLITQPLVPTAAPPGNPTLALTVNGTGFVQGATVNWNGSALLTGFVSSSQLTATVPGTDVATAGTASITVANPGGANSNSLPFYVTASSSLVAFLRTDYSVTKPQAVAIGDFNGDGKLDLAVTVSSGLQILLGNGDGTFQAPVSYNYGAGQQPLAIIAADFNGDGKLDLAFTLTLQTSMVAVCLGNGDGTFQAPAESMVGSFPDALASGDFNADGKLDLAITDADSGQVSILLGNGDGTFQPEAQFPVNGYLVSVATGDFNRDGKLDLAVSFFEAGTGVAILLGNGDGTFQPAVKYTAGRGTVVTADFNGDGKLDLAVAGTETGGVAVLLGNGDGTFQAEVVYAAGFGSTGLAATDFNGDGVLDLVASNGFPNTVNVLLGNSDGTFQKPIQFSTGPNPESPVVGDFNGDGRGDIATADPFGPSVSVLLQTTGPAVSLSPTTLAFGVQAVGGITSTQTATLTNIGASNLAVSTISVTDADFLETNTCPASLAPFTRCKISVSFKPLTIGAHAGEVTIADNAPGSPQTISLSGTGTFITLSPTALNFGTVQIGQTSAPQTVTVTNVSTQAVTIHRISTSAPQFQETNNCGSSLPGRSSCTVTVTFAPTGIGTINKTLYVGDNGGASPQAAALTGTGN